MADEKAIDLKGSKKEVKTFISICWQESKKCQKGNLPPLWSAQKSRPRSWAAGTRFCTLAGN